MTGISNIKTGLRAVFAVAVLAAAFVLPAQAFAQDNCANAGSDPTAAQYCSPSGAQTGAGNGSPKVKSAPVSNSAPVSTAAAPSTAVAETSSSGSLPFTGFDVGILLLVAVVLTGTGLALRRLTASGANKG